MENFPVQHLKEQIKEEIIKISYDLSRVEPGNIKVSVHNEYIIVESAGFLSQGARIVAQTPEGRDAIASYHEILKERIVKSIPYVKTMEEMGIIIQNIYLDIDPSNDKAIAIVHLSKAPWLMVG